MSICCDFAVLVQPLQKISHSPEAMISHSPEAINDMSPSPKPPAKVEATNFATDDMAEDPANYLKGWPLHVVTVAFVAICSIL